MGRLLEASDWDFLLNCSSVNERMKAFHDELFRMFDHCFPEKKKVIYSESEPFMTGALLKLRRKKNREFNKHRKSPKYIQLACIMQAGVLNLFLLNYGEIKSYQQLNTK